MQLKMQKSLLLLFSVNKALSLCRQHFIYIVSLNVHNNLMEMHYYYFAHCTEKETKA